MNIFKDKSIVEQSDCVISDGERKCEGFSLFVKGCDESQVEILITEKELHEALTYLGYKVTL